MFLKGLAQPRNPIAWQSNPRLASAEPCRARALVPQHNSGHSPNLQWGWPGCSLRDWLPFGATWVLVGQAGLRLRGLESLGDPPPGEGQGRPVCLPARELSLPCFHGAGLWCQDSAAGASEHCQQELGPGCQDSCQESPVGVGEPGSGRDFWGGPAGIGNPPLGLLRNLGQRGGEGGPCLGASLGVAAERAWCWLCPSSHMS